MEGGEESVMSTQEYIRKVIEDVGLAGIVQASKHRKIADTHEGGEESVMSTQEYIRKVIEDVGVTHDAVILCVIPITLTGAVKRWVERHLLGFPQTSFLSKGQFKGRKGKTKMAEPGMTTLRLHYCKPIQEMSNNTFKLWATYDPSLNKCNGGDTIYGLDEQGALKAMRYNEWFVENNEHQNYENTSLPYLGDYTIASGRITNPDNMENLILSIKSYFPNSLRVHCNKHRPRDYSFKEWLKVKVRHTNVNKSVKNAVLNEWILDSFDVESSSSGMSNDPYSRNLEEYKSVFDNEVENLANEYELRIGKKGTGKWVKVQGNDSKGDGHRRKCPKGN
nr:hypothetical protein [Tanacetum cinerariifolium]